MYLLFSPRDLELVRWLCLLVINGSSGTGGALCGSLARYAPTVQPAGEQVTHGVRHIPALEERY